MGAEDNEPDFSGWATKANLKCSDGRTIMPDAFQHQDGMWAPLVWAHVHNDPENILGKVYLEHRDEGVYCYAYFNETAKAQSAKQLVEHGDVVSLSIYANRLVEKGKNVIHGMIREVSLVLSGANPGALIDNVRVRHADDDGYDILEDEAIIYSGLELEHADLDSDEEDEDEGNEDIEHADDEETVQDVFNTLSAKQKDVVYFMIGEALSGAAAAHADLDEALEHADQTVKDVFDSFTDVQKDVVYFMVGTALENANSAAHSDTDNQEGTTMKHNVFEADANKDNGPVLTHADQTSIFEGAKKMGTLKEAVEAHALKHGIEDIEVLFPDAKAITSTPDFLKRRTEWVNVVMTETRHTPFSRIKSLLANLTLEEARAKGYVKGNLKKEEFFKVSKRVTTPQTVYKKQKLDRDDILDITDFDVVVWLKGEMRLMLEEEIARAILIGDGRSAGDDDKIKEEHVRPIATDDELYVTYVYVNLDDANSSAEEVIDALTMQRRHYRGSGNPTFFTSETMLARLLLIKDTLGRRIYPTVNDVAAALRVSKIVTVEVMDEPGQEVVGIMVNLTDYNVGADKGGDVALFDDFDIDYNQYKYLIETRISGALVKAKSALVVKKVESTDTLVVPEAPTFDPDDHTVTVATTAGITYKNKLTNTTLTTGSPVTLSEGDELTVIAIPTAGNYLASSAEDEFFFTYEDGYVEGAIS